MNIRIYVNHKLIYEETQYKNETVQEMLTRIKNSIQITLVDTDTDLMKNFIK